MNIAQDDFEYDFDFSDDPSRLRQRQPDDKRKIFQHQPAMNAMILMVETNSTNSAAQT